MQIIKQNFSWLRILFFSVNIIFYLFFAWLSLSRGNFITEHLETFSVFGHLLVKLIFLFLSLWYAFFIFLRKKWQEIELRVSFIIILVICLFTFPILSQDTSYYFFMARNFFSGLNPYFVPLNYNNEFSHLFHSYWVSLPTPYGPSFLPFFFLPALVFKNSLIGAIYFYKLIVLGVFLFSLFIFKKILIIKKLPAHLFWFYAFNPALLLQLVIDGHNELIIITFLLLSLFYLTLEKKVWAQASLIISIFIKYTSFILWPIMWFKDGKFSGKNFFYSNFILIASTIIILFASGLLPKQIFSNLAYLNQSCFYVCSPLMQLIDNYFINYEFIIRFSIFFVLYLLILYVFLFRKFSREKFIFWTLVVFLFIFIRSLTPWYILLIIPFGILANDRKYLSASLFFSIYSLFFYP